MKEKAQGAFQRHADFYMNLLMDPERTPYDLRIELGQIQLAFHRIREEEVGTNYHPGQIEVKLREVSGGHANVFLPKLLDGTATVDDMNEIQVALNSVALNEVDYPLSLKALTGMFKDKFKVDPKLLTKSDK